MRRTASISAAFLVAALIGGVAPAAAQYGGYRAAPDAATGERYHVEIAGGFWNPTPQLIISSESLGIPGTDIDLVSDLGIEQTRFKEFRAVLRPARKHKFRVNYIPIRYESESVLTRRIVFNGIEYRVGLPVRSTAEWDAWRFGYEYDFVYRDRGFVGLILEAKYTRMRVDLASPVAHEFASVKAPIPAVGGVARGYIFPNLAVTGELTGIKLPGSVVDRENDSGSYWDYDIYGTLNPVNNFGMQFGYRSIDVNYVIKQDFGDLSVRGFYFMGVVRF
jgi:hypothetical protein